MTVGDIKKKASEFFTEYLNHTIDSCCVNADKKDVDDDFFPLDISKNFSRLSDTFKEHSQETLEVFLHSKNKTGVGYSLDVEYVNTRSNGRKSIIKSVYFENENDYLDFINVKSRVENLKFALAILSMDKVLPPTELRGWAKKHVKDLTAVYEDGAVFWHNIGQCALWVNKNTKGPLQYIPAEFVATNKKLIQSLFKNGEAEIQIVSAQKKLEPQNKSPAKKILEDAEHVVEKNEVESVTTENVARESKPFFIRFRSLSADNPLKLGRLVPKEVSLQLDDFVHLNQTNFLKEITTVLIVNDESVFQNFPKSEHVLCIYGPDYAVNALKLCEWFSRYQLIYFGDISEHCFDVLSAFRNTWMKTETICMDGNTWEKFVGSTVPSSHLKNNVVPKNLNESEKNTFLSLRLTSDRNKLPQEKIPMDYALQFLDAIKICGQEEKLTAEENVES